MLSRKSIGLALLAATVSAPLVAQGYERELSSRSLREAYFLGRDNTFRSERFLKGYVETFPRPDRGVHVVDVRLATPFKEMVDRARRAPDGYNPLKAEKSYREVPPAVVVEITISLTATYPAHTPYTIPAFDPIAFRDPGFWQEFEIHLVQRGEIAPATHRGRATYSCDIDGGCWLSGAVITLTYDPERVESDRTRVYIFTPDGQEVEAEFDLGKLR